MLIVGEGIGDRILVGHAARKVWMPKENVMLGRRHR